MEGPKSYIKNGSLPKWGDPDKNPQFWETSKSNVKDSSRAEASGGLGLKICAV